MCYTKRVAVEITKRRVRFPRLPKPAVSLSTTQFTLKNRCAIIGLWGYRHCLSLVYPAILPLKELNCRVTNSPLWIDILEVCMEVIKTKTTFKRGYNPKSLKNLKPALPGNHLSPGRPVKADCLLSCIKEALLKVAANGLTNEQNIGNVLVAKAAEGDMKAIDLMLSYLHSKPVNKTEISGGGTLIIRVVEDGNKQS